MSQKRFFLESMTFKNYRCFGELSVNFHEYLTAFVAPNGGGKTAILDGIAVALRRFVDTLENRDVSYGFDNKDIRLVISPENTMEPVTPARFEAQACFFGKRIVWARERRSVAASSRTTTVEAAELTEVARNLHEENLEWLDERTGIAPLFPLVSYYGTGRLWSSGKLTKGTRTKDVALNARHRGYADCLSSTSHYKYFIDWFRRFSYEAKKAPGSSESPHEPHRVLAAVRAAVDLALAPTGWNGLEWDFAEETIVAHHNDFGRLPVDILSDGIRNMIGLVADIAHRAARLNPHLQERAAVETAGIVLVDEVEMHLHPEWQQVVLRSLQAAFPLVQFIVTTDSPQVLTTVSKENIRVLNQDKNGQWTAEPPKHSPLARSAGDALAYVMDVDPQPKLDILDKVHEYEQLVKAGKKVSEEALSLRRDLDQAGYEIPEADLAMWEFLAGKPQKGSS